MKKLMYTLLTTVFAFGVNAAEETETNKPASPTNRVTEEVANLSVEGDEATKEEADKIAVVAATEPAKEETEDADKKVEAEKVTQASTDKETEETTPVTTADDEATKEAAEKEVVVAGPAPVENEEGATEEADQTDGEEVATATKADAETEKTGSEDVPDDGESKD